MDDSHKNPNYAFMPKTAKRVQTISLSSPTKLTTLSPNPNAVTTPAPTSPQRAAPQANSEESATTPATANPHYGHFPGKKSATPTAQPQSPTQTQTLTQTPTQPRTPPTLPPKTLGQTPPSLTSNSATSPKPNPSYRMSMQVPRATPAAPLSPPTSVSMRNVTTTPSPAQQANYRRTIAFTESPVSPKQQQQALANPRPQSTVVTVFPNLDGYLEKKGDVGLIKGWKKRYFRLTEDRLVYYKERTDYSNGLPIFGFVVLTDALKIEPDPNCTDFVFTLVTKQRIWYLRADSKSAMDRWVNACKIHSGWKEEEHSMNAGLGGLTRKDMTPHCGYLNKKHKAQWVSRWFAVRDGILYKFNNKDDDIQHKFAEKWPLYQSTVEVGGADAVTGEFRVTIKHKENKLLILKAYNDRSLDEWVQVLHKHKLITEQIIDGTNNNNFS